MPPGPGQVPGLCVAALAGDLLGRGTSVRIRVTGSSMSPFIRSGDVVTLVPPPSRGVRLGDVIAFSPQPGRMVVHRVVAGTARAPLTRGDAALAIDEPGTVLGAVVQVERAGRALRLGLGRERLLIALAQRWGLLGRLRSLVGVVVRAARAWLDWPGVEPGQAGRRVA